MTSSESPAGIDSDSISVTKPALYSRFVRSRMDGFSVATARIYTIKSILSIWVTTGLSVCCAWKTGLPPRDIRISRPRRASVSCRRGSRSSRARSPRVASFTTRPPQRGTRGSNRFPTASSRTRPTWPGASSGEPRPPSASPRASASRRARHDFSSVDQDGFGVGFSLPFLLSFSLTFSLTLSFSFGCTVSGCRPR